MPKKDLNDVLFADRLRHLRKQHGWTQQQVADLLGIKRSTYAYYETKTSEPDMETLMQLALLFHTSVDYLIGHQANGKSTNYLHNKSDLSPNSLLTEQEETLLRMFRCIGEEYKEQILAELNDMLRDTYNRFPDETTVCKNL